MEKNAGERLEQRALQDMEEAVLILDQDGRILYANKPARTLLELKEDAVQGRAPLFEIAKDACNDSFVGAVRNAVGQKQRMLRDRIRYRTPSGRTAVFRLSSARLEDGDQPQTILTLMDETEEEQLEEKSKESSHLFTTFLFAFCIWMIIYALWEYLGRPVSPDLMTSGVEVMGVILFFFVMRYEHLNWRDLGLAADNPVRTVRTGALIAVCALGFLMLVKAAVRLFNPNAFGPGLPFIDFAKFGPRQLRYIFTAGIQEFLARSVMQGNLERIMVSKNPKFGAIVLSSLIFAVLHIHLGLIFMLGAAILAGLEGILYTKQRSIYGVWIVHWVFGVGGTLLSMISH